MTDKEQYKVLANNLNRILSQSGKSQKEVADAIGVSPQTFNTWCQGIALPRMGKLQLLADYFKLNKSDFIEPYNQDSDAFSITDEEQQIIKAYRSAPEGIKESVCKLLDVRRQQEEISSA